MMEYKTPISLEVISSHINHPVIFFYFKTSSAILPSQLRQVGTDQQLSKSFIRSGSKASVKPASTSFRESEGGALSQQ